MTVFSAATPQQHIWPYTITSIVCTPSQPLSVHHHSHCLYTITSIVCTPSQPLSVHHHIHCLYTITAIVCIPSQPLSVHHHIHCLYTITAIVCTPSHPLSVSTFKFGSLRYIFHRLRNNHVKTLNVQFYYRILINH